MAWQRRWLAVVAFSGCLVAVVRSCRIMRSDAFPRARHYAAPPASAGPNGGGTQPLQIARPMPLDTPSPFQPAPVSITPVSGIQPATYASRGSVKVRVSAWVNGQPIFENEVGADGRRRTVPYQKFTGRSTSGGKDRRNLQHGPSEQLMDQEVLYQDAVKRHQEKQSARAGQAEGIRRSGIRQIGGPDAHRPRCPRPTSKRWSRLPPTCRGQISFSTEYVRSRIKGIVKALVGLVQVREYYDEHKNEFRSVKNRLAGHLHPLDRNLSNPRRPEAFWRRPGQPLSYAGRFQQADRIRRPGQEWRRARQLARTDSPRGAGADPVRPGAGQDRPGGAARLGRPSDPRDEARIQRPVAAQRRGGEDNSQEAGERCVRPRVPLHRARASSARGVPGGAGRAVSPVLVGA